MALIAKPVVRTQLTCGLMLLGGAPSPVGRPAKSLDQLAEPGRNKVRTPAAQHAHSWPFSTWNEHDRTQP